MNIDINKLLSGQWADVKQALEQIKKLDAEFEQDMENYDCDTTAETVRKDTAKRKMLAHIIRQAKNYHGCPYDVDLMTFLRPDHDEWGAYQ